MQQAYKYRIRKRDFGDEIFCEVRKIWVQLTPEENVHQQFVRYLVVDLGFEIGRISVEHGFTLDGGKTLRADIVVFNKSGKAEILIECKAPSVSLGIEPFRQASKYNNYFKAQYVVLTNGNSILIAKTNDLISYNLVEELPSQ